MYEDEPMPYVLSFDPIAERAKALAELINSCPDEDNIPMYLEALKVLVESMKPPPMPTEEGNVTPFKPTAH